MPKLSPLASVSATREVLEQHGLMTKKALGQHFLINDGVVEKICDLAGLEGSDDVIEVGPGIGTLTVALLQRSARVTSVERDADLPPVLAQTCAGYEAPFTLIEGDALEIDFDALPFHPRKLVSNLPYAVAATIVLDYFQREPALDSATVMVQAEVADRMAAKPGTKNYGAYTVKLSLYAHPAGRFQVNEGNFFPPPRVKSAVIRLDRNDSAIDPAVRAAAAVMANAAFANRRKTIANSCKTYFSNLETAESGMKDAVAELLELAGVPATARGEKLEPERFLDLGRAYLRIRGEL